jgi:outer membrane protein assembly factor BamB
MWGLPALIVPAVGAGTAPQVAWSVPIDAVGTPAFDRTHVYAWTRAGDLVAVDRRTRATVWRVRPDVAPGVLRSHRVLAGSGVVITGSEGLDGVGVEDGHSIWRARHSAGDGIGVYLGQAADGLAFAGSYSGHLVAIDIRTGRARWAVSIGFDGRTTVFPPVVAGGDVFATFTSFGAETTGGVVALTTDGRVRWRVTLDGAAGRGAVGRPVATSHLVFAASRTGRVFVIDRATGRVTRSLSPSRPGIVEDFRPLAVIGDVLVAGSLTGELTAYDVESGHRRWTAWPVEASVAFGMAAGRRTVYVPYISGVLVAVDVRDGRERWRIGSSGAGFRWPPAVDGSTILACGSTAGLVAFEETGGIQ